MAGTQDEDMYLFAGGLDQTPSAFAGQDFDNFLDQPPGANLDQSVAFLNPNDLSIKKEQTTSNSDARHGAVRSSRSSASSGSTSESAEYASRVVSNSSTISPSSMTRSQPWSSGINGMTMPSDEQFYDDAAMDGITDDLDASNQEMASAFDFDTAASTPSGYDAASVATLKASSAQPFRRTLNMPGVGQPKSISSQLSATGQPQFYVATSREASPLNAMLPQSQSHSPWTKHSPSSGLEETFNHITMNGDSPGNATFSPNMQFSSNGFSFDPDSSGTPSTFNKDVSSPPSTIHSGDGTTQFTIYPTSLKSRVETQIPIKMVIYPLPAGVKKLRLPTHTVSKPKFLAKPEVERSPEVLELQTSLVCTSAMQDPARLERALARARGEDLSAYTRPSPESSTGSHTSSRDDEDKPLNGGEVKICSGCIQRERKRASRKKQKKPEEEELFQKDEERRVVVFNTSEIKDWVEAPKDTPSPGEPSPVPHPGAMQVELPMRIACYCRHQNEKMGFQVIFTVKDYRDKVIAQACTNSIMITDDHKTHNAPASLQASQIPQAPSGSQLPGAGVFATSGLEAPPSAGLTGKLFKQSFSTTDLHNLQHNFNPHFPMSPTSNPFAIPGPMSAMTSGTMTPRNLSRPASPNGLGGPNTKRRKQSGSGKVPSGLTMTRLDTASAPPAGPATMPNTAASSPYATHMTCFMSPADRFTLAPARQPSYGTSPPTPTNESMFSSGVNRTFSLENLPRQALISAPGSRQPSRPSSPRSQSNRNSFVAADPGFGQAVNNGLLNHPSRRPNPTIHKLVPAEGSVTGGTEVTLLGNGFYQGLEVMFGDTEATTTTFWGEKCLNCIAPPALQPGVVAVVFKHEHPQYSALQQQSQIRHSVFTYIDDREVEILRLALRTLGKNMQHPTDDPYSAAQQLLQQNQPQGMWPQGPGYMMGGGHQRQSVGFSNPYDLVTLESDMLSMLHVVQNLGPGKLNLRQRRPNGMAIVHLAASLGMTRFVEALLRAGCDANLMDKCGNTAMHHAAIHGHVEIVQHLKLAGADHRVRGIRSFLPSDLATTLSAYQAILKPIRHLRSSSTNAEIKVNSDRSLRDAPLHIQEEVKRYYDDSDTDDVSGDEELSDVRERQIRPQERHMPTVTVNQSSLISSNENNSGALPQVWKQLLSLTGAQQRQILAQIQHLQDTSQWTFPQLPALPSDIPVVRRMSLLFPRRGSSAPPAYEELFPGKTSSRSDLEVKQQAAVQAAAEAAIDTHFDLQDKKLYLQSYPREGGHSLADISKLSTSTPSKHPGRHRNLLFFFLPISVIMLGLMTVKLEIFRAFLSRPDLVTLKGRKLDVTLSR